jgi:hypothetical protein
VNAPVVTDLLTGAFDWVVNNNLELPVPGFATAPIDVVLIGLSDDWLTGTAETERVIREASDAGLTVIVAFGNRGPQPYMASAAGSAGYAVSVGSTYAPGEHGMLYEGTWSAEGQAQRREGVAIDSQIVGQPDAWPAGFSGPLASMDTACDDVPAEQPVAGKVALILRGECAFAEKMLNAQAAGAVSAVVYTTSTLPVQPMAGAAQLTIPAVMIDYPAGQAMREALAAGTAVSIQVWEPDQDLFADVQSAFANRGPSRATAGVKPQVTAPGQYILSAWLGGTTRVQTGTSMGAAHVAGAAALLAQRKKAKRLDVDAAEIGALLVNYAHPGVARVFAHLGADAVDDALPAPVDLTDLALRYYPADPADPESDMIMEFAVRTRGGRRLPQDAEVRVYIDLDRDNVFDELIWSQHAPDFADDLAPGRWIVSHGILPPGKLEPADAEVDPNVTIVYQPYSLDETSSRLLVSADDIGIDLRSAGELFNVAAQVVDTRAEYEPVGGAPAQDSLPDNLAAGGAVVFDQLVHGCVTPLAQVTVPGGGEFPLALAMACDPPEKDTPLALFLDHASNVPGPAQAALRPGVLASTAGPSPTPPDGHYYAFLPVARNKE